MWVMRYANGIGGGATWKKVRAAASHWQSPLTFCAFPQCEHSVIGTRLLCNAVWLSAMI